MDFRKAELFKELVQVQMNLAAAKFAVEALREKAMAVSLNEDRDSQEFARALFDRAIDAQVDVHRLLKEQARIQADIRDEEII